ncbi:MAG: hypothetical protein WC708_09350 [Lentisphaeria bacterium]
MSPSNNLPGFASASQLFCEPRVLDESTNRAAWLDGNLPAPA